MVICANRACARAAVAAALLSIPLFLAAERHAAPDKRPAAPKRESVEMFAAMDSGDIAVKVVAKSDRKAQIRIKNNTDRPLSVRLPEAVAAAPVAAQFFPIPPAPNGRNRRGNNNTTNSNTNSNTRSNLNQTIGTGLIGQGNGPGGNNGPFNGQGNPWANGPGGGRNAQNWQGNGIFNIPPEGEAKFYVETLCLEHGKRNPRSAIRYEIKPIESFTSDPAVKELLKIFGQSPGQIDHEAAQAAAWHLTDRMSWKTLANKRRAQLNGTSKRYFTPAQIESATKLVERAVAQSSQPPAVQAPQAVTQSR